MKFKEGESGNPAGRPKGSVNAINRTVKETVLKVFQELQQDEDHNLSAFARRFPRDFHAIAAKLIPTEVKSEISMPEGIKLIFNLDPGSMPMEDNGKGD